MVNIILGLWLSVMWAMDELTSLGVVIRGDMTRKEEIRAEAVRICEESGLGWGEATYLIDFLYTYLDKSGVVIAESLI